jgi:hypothetical protein
MDKFSGERRVMGYRDIVILANSRRHNGHCIAGKDLATFQWIRPINILGNGQPRLDQSAFLDSDFKALTGNPSSPGLLDCVRIGFGNNCPLYYQPENISIDATRWETLSPYPPNEITKFVDNPKSCCLQDADPYYKTIPARDLIGKPPKPSLSMIRLNRKSNNIEIEHTTKQGKNPQHRLHFNYGTKRYDFPITDYQYEILVAQSQNDDARIFNDCFVTVGLGEKFSPYDTNLELHYRFIVGIYPASEI